MERFFFSCILRKGSAVVSVIHEKHSQILNRQVNLYDFFSFIYSLRTMSPRRPNIRTYKSHLDDPLLPELGIFITFTNLIDLRCVCFTGVPPALIVPPSAPATIDCAHFTNYPAVQQS